MAACFWVDEGAVAVNPLLWFQNKQIVPFVVRIQTLRAIRRCFHVVFWLKGKTQMRRVSINLTKKYGVSLCFLFLGWLGVCKQAGLRSIGCRI